MMTTLLQDLRYGLRMLIKTPVVSGVAALSLSLGIAANAGMFSILDGFLLDPVPWNDPQELVLLRELQEGRPIEFAAGVSVPNFRDYTQATQNLEGAFLYTIERANLTGLDAPEQLQVVVATPSILDVLEEQPFLGRGFRAEEGAEGRGNILVLEHGYWETRFFSDRDVLGRTVTLDGTPYTIVGVMPEDFDMVPANIQAIRPSDFADQIEDRANHGYLGFARLRPGATPEQVERELQAVSQQLTAEFPDAKRGWNLIVVPLPDFFPGPTDRKLVIILSAVALFGLLIACANVANLLLSRAESRQKEVAVRTAMGAGRGRILRQLLTESVALGVVAGAVGVGLSIYLIQWIAGAMPPEMPAAMVPALNLNVLVATVLVSILAGIAFGLMPAVHATRGELREALGEGSRGGTASRARKRMRNAFVVGEFAVALALLTGAGVLIEAFDQIANDDPGFRAEGLLTFQIAALEDRYPENEDLVTYERELLRELEGVAGVSDVAVMSSLPRGRDNGRTRYTVDGRPVPEEIEQPTADFQAVNPAYFSTLEIDVVRGRGFEASDRDDGQLVALVSQALADREFPNEDPLGKSLTVRGESRVIVGVVENVMQARIALAGRQGEAIYLPIEQFPLRNPSFALRTVGEPTAVSGDVRQAVWSVEPDQPIASLRTLRAHIDESLAGPQTIMVFLVMMAGIALVLAAMGIYGVMAHAVIQQRREIGIRMALGAGQGSVVRMITRSGLTLAGVGILLGLPLAYLMTLGVANAVGLFADSLPYGYAVGVSVALVVAATISTYLPARRASGFAPVTALREE